MKRSGFILSASFFLLFVGFTLLVRTHGLDHFDLAMTVLMQQHLSQLIYTGFSFLSLLGAAEIISLFLLPIFFIYRRKSLILFAAYGFGTLIEMVGKQFLNHPGPPHRYFRYDLSFKLPSSLVETFHSYPSGHVFRTLFVVTCWLLLLKQTTLSIRTKYLVTIAGVIFCAMMLVSRVALGEHWTTDVIGGSLLALSLSIGSLTLFNTAPNVLKKEQRQTAEGIQTHAKKLSHSSYSN